MQLFFFFFFPLLIPAFLHFLATAASKGDKLQNWIAGLARSHARPPAALLEPSQQLSMSEGWITPRMRQEQVPASKLMETMECYWGTTAGNYTWLCLTTPRGRVIRDQTTFPGPDFWFGFNGTPPFFYFFSFPHTHLKTCSYYKVSRQLQPSPEHQWNTSEFQGLPRVYKD